MWVAVGEAEHVRLLNAQSGEAVLTLPGDGVAVDALAWHPDGTTLATAGARIRLWDLETARDFLRAPARYLAEESSQRTGFPTR